MKKIIMLLLLAPGILAADKVYKWLDNKGVIQYSSAPPITVRPGDVELDAGDIISFEPKITQPAVTQQVSNDNNSQASIYCRKLRSNLITLYKNKRVRIRHANGQFSELDENGKNEKITEISDLLKKHCHGDN